MRKLIPLLFLLCAPLAQAQCTNNGGSPQAWSCIAGSTVAQFQAAINGSTDGAIITAAPGSYAGGRLLLVPGHGFTIICATPPLAIGAATVNPCTITSTGTVFGSANDPVSGTNTHLYRFSGFQITGNLTGHSPFNFCDQNGCNGTLTQLRIDHNTCACAKGTEFVFGTNGTSGGYWGVIDHNIINAPDTASIASFISQTQPTPPALQLGTINNMFIEDNQLNITTMTAGGASQGCTDGWGAAAMVVRHNTSVNCLWTTHGTTHNGGPYNYEFYNNSATLNSGAIGSNFENGNRLVHTQGAGTLMAFNNIFGQVSGHPHGGDTIEIQHYRDFAFTANGPAAASPACGTPGVNQWATDCITNPCDGTSVSNAPDGNRAPTTSNYGYPCWRQPGRDVATQNLQPMYAWNNAWADDGSEAPFNLADSPTPGVVPPSCVATSNGTCDYKTFHLQYDREAEQAVSNLAQTSPTSPFNGTTGMGFGTLANRPTTCTTFSEPGSGVGYAAGTTVGTIGASGSGTPGDYVVYRCSATNTWTLQYTPFTYPHPLVGALAPIATFCSSSVNIGLVPIGLTTNPVNCSLTNTGNANLVATSISVNTSIFSVVSNTCGASSTITFGSPGAGFTLTPTASCTFQVQATAPVASAQIWTDAVNFIDNNPATGQDLLPLQITSTGPPAPAPTVFAWRKP